MRQQVVIQQDQLPATLEQPIQVAHLAGGAFLDRHHAERTDSETGSHASETPAPGRPAPGRVNSRAPAPRFPAPGANAGPPPNYRAATQAHTGAATPRRAASRRAYGRRNWPPQSQPGAAS